MANEFSCKCGAGPFEGTAPLRIHILQGARADGKGIHGWTTTRFPNPPPAAVEPPVIEMEPSAASMIEIRPPAFDVEDEDPDHSAIAFELEQIQYFLRAVRSEFDAVKAQVGATSSIWADVVRPVPVDQEAINLAQLNAMMGIDQPGRLAIQEQILTAMAERVEDATIEAPMAPLAILIETPRGKKPIARGVFLILAFVAVVAIIVLVITQT